jgi:hypothetical protein
MMTVGSPEHTKQGPNEDITEGNQNSYRRIYRELPSSTQHLHKRKEYEEEKLQLIQTYNAWSESRKFYQEVWRFK